MAVFENPPLCWRKSPEPVPNPCRPREPVPQALNRYSPNEQFSK